MGWQLSGVWTESCTCSITCPCNLNEDPTNGNCDVAFCFHVKTGSVDGVAIEDVPVVWTVNLPGAFTAGNAKARLYIDENASGAQRAALEPIFQGNRGGVWAVLSGIVAEWLETKYTSIKVVDEGDLRTVTVGNYGQIVAENVKDHQGKKALLIDPPLLTGASIHSFEISRGRGTSWRDNELNAFEGVHAGKSEFQWFSDEHADEPVGMPAGASS